MLELVGIGTSDAIHRYNPRLQDTGAGGRFDAFEMHSVHPRPVRFHNELVPGTQFLDHQGHIVPQNAYAARLNLIAGALDGHLRSLAPGSYDITNANQYLTTTYPALNFQYVTAYINNILVNAGGAPAGIFVDPNGNDLEERLGGYFSVINWNPVNIARAPSDNHRGGYPGNAPDNIVVLKLLTASAAAGVMLPQPYATFLTNNIQNLAATPDQLISAGNACLPLMPAGFYKFNWAPIALGPQL